MADEPPDDDKELDELLQELRVALPGVQVLLAVLLTVPFSSGFGELSETARWTFFSAVAAAALAAVLFIAPSAHHRFAWPLAGHELRFLVRVGTIEARLGLLALGWTVTAAVYVVAGLIIGEAGALLTAIVVGGLAFILWLAAPRLMRAARG